jgi:hypothetical protein
MRMICVGTLLENSVLQDFLGELDPELDSLLVTYELADRALQQMHKALCTRDYVKIAMIMGCGPPNGDAFPTIGGLSYDDVDLLVLTLWKDRHAIITIGEHGLLPGLGVLLFVLCEMTITSPTEM